MSSLKTFKSSQWVQLQAVAENSPRRRAHFNLHATYEETIQKTLICLLKGTYIPPHYHQHNHQKELFVVLSGVIKVIVFDQIGRVEEVVLLESGEMIEVPKAFIHTVISLSDVSFVLETKQGPFIENDCKEFLEWTILEDDLQSGNYLAWLKEAKVGFIYD